MLVKRMNFKQYTDRKRTENKRLGTTLGEIGQRKQRVQYLPWDKGEVEKHVQFAHNLYLHIRLTPLQ